jgi:hypothetical protein
MRPCLFLRTENFICYPLRPRKKHYLKEKKQQKKESRLDRRLAAMPKGNAINEGLLCGCHCVYGVVFWQRISSQFVVASRRNLRSLFLVFLFCSDAKRS